MFARLFHRIVPAKDPHDHPAIRAMSAREVADLPSPFRGGGDPARG